MLILHAEFEESQTYGLVGSHQDGLLVRTDDVGARLQAIEVPELGRRGAGLGFGLKADLCLLRWRCGPGS